MIARSGLVFLSLFCISMLDAEPTYLYQKDFEEGTYLINKPGEYKLAEDISFNPNSTRALKTDAYHAGLPLKQQLKSQGGKYDDKSFGLGFFAAIVIDIDNVTVDLDGYTLEQSPEHALLQRFFAVIEIANQPFIPGQGPHDFGSKIESAKKTVIKNGTIGRSSHHGIHGNGNRNIQIKNVLFKDFEIAAVALNGVDGLLIENCKATSRTDVPVLGTFSSARFIQPYIDYLVEKKSRTTLNIGHKKSLSAQQVKERLVHAINAVHEDLIVGGKSLISSWWHPDEYALFHNSAGIVDGNCYGFLVNAIGQAVEGFPVQSRYQEYELAKNIRISNVHVDGLQGKVNEIVALNHQGESVVDPVGAVFQIKNKDPETQKPITVSSDDDREAIYIGNPVANAQAFVAKAYINGDFNGSDLDLSRLKITQKVINWIEADPSTPESKLVTLAPTEDDYICNGDSMFHVNKGVVAFKIDAAKNVILENTTAKNVANLSEVGADYCGKYTISHPKATLPGCGGPKTRAYSIAGSSKVRMNNSTVEKLSSRCGTVVGFDIQTDSSDIYLDHAIVSGVDAGMQFVQNNAPNEEPMAIGFRVSPQAKDIVLLDVCGREMKGKGGQFPVIDKSRRARTRLTCP